MIDIEGYLPFHLRVSLMASVDRAIENDDYKYEFEYWKENFPLGLAYFQYNYFREVICIYIETHGAWKESGPDYSTIFNPTGG